MLKIELLAAVLRIDLGTKFGLLLILRTASVLQAFVCDD